MMENVYDVIISGLIKAGHTAKEAEELVATFMEEQRQLDNIRDIIHSLIKEK